MITHKEYLQIRELRQEDNNKKYFLNRGTQTNAFNCKSKYVIIVGTRGSAKTTGLLLHNLKNINNKGHNSIILRRKIKDSQGVGGIVDASKKIFQQFGEYKESIQLMYWSFKSGAKTAFLNYSSTIEEFREAIQGKEFSDIYIDEGTHMQETHFSELNSSLRNTNNIYTQIVISCNPDPDSWLKNLVMPYLDPETECHRKDMNGKELFFIQYGDNSSECYWGESKEEV